MDVSTMFPNNISEEIGVFKFQIEDFHPVMMEHSLLNIFYTGDCYIVLNVLVYYNINSFRIILMKIKLFNMKYFYGLEKILQYYFS